MKTMRPQRAVLPLVFLSAAFMLGCQDQGLEPVGPESLGILLDKGPIHSGGHGGGGGGDATFTATITVDVTSVGAIGLTGKTSLQTDPGTPGVDGSPATLDLSFFADTGIEGAGITKGDICFGGGPFEGPFQIIVKKNDLINANIQFNFPAKGDDGTPDVVNYGLQLPGVMAPPDDWPPAVANTITGTTFSMVHSNGPGNKVACTGTGLLNFSILVVRDQ